MPTPPPIGRHLLDRRRFLSSMSGGLGAVALGSLLAEQSLLAAGDAPDPLAPKPPHFAPKAKRVIQIFCTGALSHLDTWDYKPELIKRDGRPMPGLDKLVTFQGENGNLARSPWAFKPRGKSGKMISDLLPRLAERADDLCFLHAMTSKTNTHGPGEMFMSTGFTLEGFPSAGAWVAYALGSESRDLPAYVAIPDPRGGPQQGPANWNNGFLPAVYQGTAFNADNPIRHLARPSGIPESADRATKEFLHLLNEEHLKAHPDDADLSARISSYELAARMQLSAPEVGKLDGESAATKALYGLNSPNPLTAAFGLRDQVCDHLFDALAIDLGGRRQDDAVAQQGQCKCLHIVGNDVIAPVERGMGPGSRRQHGGRTRRSTGFERGTFARCPDQPHDIVDDVVDQPHARDTRCCRIELGCIGNGGNAPFFDLRRAETVAVTRDDRQFFVEARIFDDLLEQEPVELRLG